MGDIIFSEKAFSEYMYWQEQDKKTLKKINNLLRDILRSPENSGIGKSEILKGNLTGYYSRRIDNKNRLVYRVKNNSSIEVYQCKGHYDD